MQVVDGHGPVQPDWWRRWTDTPEDRLDAQLLVQAFDALDRRILLWFVEREGHSFVPDEWAAVLEGDEGAAHRGRGIDERIARINMFAVSFHRERLIDRRDGRYSVSTSGALVIAQAIRAAEAEEAAQRRFAVHRGPEV